MADKVGVVLFNLGGPDKLESVRPFLFNLFYDKDIIKLPNPLRWIIAKVISQLRERKSREIYSQIGNGSPILQETIKQANALEMCLNKNSKKHIFKIYICMRYWHPFSKDVVEKIAKDKLKRIILLPLYPQFSSTTTGSSIKDFLMNAEKLKIPTSKIYSYFRDKDFINAHCDLIKDFIKKLKNNKFRILFSAHGLPESIIKNGDPYQYQVEQTVAEIVSNLNITKLDYKICYQSKVGPMKWIGPSSESEIIKCAKDKKTVVIVPITFVSEHSETLVELDIDYKKLYLANGGKNFIRVQTLGTHKNFVKALSKICLKNLNKDDKDSF